MRDDIGLNHLQGEYWIATAFHELVGLVGTHYCLNHLQGEYWIATKTFCSGSYDELTESESSPGRILDCDCSATTLTVRDWVTV